MNNDQEQVDKNLSELLDLEELEDTLDALIESEINNPLLLTPNDVLQVIDYMDYEITDEQV